MFLVYVGALWSLKQRGAFYKRLRISLELIAKMKVTVSQRNIAYATTAMLLWQIQNWHCCQITRNLLKESIFYVEWKSIVISSQELTYGVFICVK